MFFWNSLANQWILKEISPNIHWKDWWWGWNSNTLATWCEELTHLERPWCWERLKAGGEVDNRGWDGWMASLTQWTWIWANSRSWWWTGKPGVLQSMRLQRVRHKLVIEQQQGREYSLDCSSMLAVKNELMESAQRDKKIPPPLML